MLLSGLGTGYLGATHAAWWASGDYVIGAVIITDLATAELAKVSANAMLATRISTVNLPAEVCLASVADVMGRLHDAGWTCRCTTPTPARTCGAGGRTSA